MRSLPPIALVLALACGLASAAQADEAGICGEWTGEIMLVRDTGEAQQWAQRFAAGDVLRGYFMKRGTPERIQTTEVTNPWHQHVNTLELFTDFADWAMNVNVNGYTLEHKSRVPVTSDFHLRTLRRDTTRNPLYGDRHDYVMWWTDWVQVSDAIEYFPHYTIQVLFEGTDAMLQTPNGLSASAADLAPSLFERPFGSAGVDETYGVVQLFSHGGFDGHAQVMGKITGVQLFPCTMVSFDPETGQYGLVGGPPEGEGGATE